MSSTIARSYLGPIRFVMLTLILIATACALFHYVLPNIREDFKMGGELGAVRKDNADLERKITQLRKDKNEYQNNNIDFLILTAHREGFTGPNEKVFEFTEPEPDPRKK